MLEVEDIVIHWLLSADRGAGRPRWGVHVYIAISEAGRSRLVTDL